MSDLRISGPARCENFTADFNVSNCSQPNKVCLSGGSTQFEGNVYFEGKPVCDDKWSKNDGEIVKTGDKIKIDLNKRRVDLLITKSDFKKRRKNKKKFKVNNQTPWQEIFRNTVSQLDDGACINSIDKYFNISNTKGIPRDSH